MLQFLLRKIKMYEGSSPSSLGGLYSKDSLPFTEIQGAESACKCNSNLLKHLWRQWHHTKMKLQEVKSRSEIDFENTTGLQGWLAGVTLVGVLNRALLAPSSKSSVSQRGNFLMSAIFGSPRA